MLLCAVVGYHEFSTLRAVVFRPDSARRFPIIGTTELGPPSETEDDTEMLRQAEPLPRGIQRSSTFLALGQPTPDLFSEEKKLTQILEVLEDLIPINP